MELQDRIDKVEKRLNQINDYLDRVVAELGKIKAEQNAKDR